MESESYLSKSRDPGLRTGDLVPSSTLIVSFGLGISLVAGWSFLHNSLQQMGINFLSIDRDVITLSSEYISYGIMSIYHDIGLFTWQILMVMIAIFLMVSPFGREGWARSVYVIVISIAALTSFQNAIDAGERYANFLLASMIHDEQTAFPKVELQFKDDKIQNIAWSKIDKNCLWRVFMDKKHIYVLEGIKGTTSKEMNIYVIKNDDLVSVKLEKKASHDLCEAKASNPQ